MEGFRVSTVGLQHKTTNIATRYHWRIEVSVQEIKQNIWRYVIVILGTNWLNIFDPLFLIDPSYTEREWYMHAWHR